MKYYLDYFVILILAIYYAKAVHLTLNQLNYRDQYEHCLEDYQKMYKMMTDKLTFYSDNERALLDSLKGTIFKTFEKSEKLQENHNMKTSELEETITRLKSELNSKEQQTHKFKSDSELKLSQLKDQLDLKSRELEQMSTNLKVIKEDALKYTNTIQQLNEQILNQKNLIDSKEKYYRGKINECSTQVRILTKNDKEKFNSIAQKFSINEKELKDIEAQFLQSKVQANRKTSEEIQKGRKIEINLDLIGRKVSSLATVSSNLEKVSTNSTSTINAPMGKEFKYFDPKVISRFLETGEKLASTKAETAVGLTSSLNQLIQTEDKLKETLDIVLFNNINKSRHIFKELENLENILTSSIEGRKICENKLAATLSETMSLKEALAESEIKFRLLKIKK